MCGLVGLITNTANGFANQDANIFKQLLYVDTLRGEDSTGVVAYYNDGAMEVIKEAIPAYNFIDSKEFTELNYALIARGKAALGHNRKKTSGTINDVTAHPFLIDGAVDKQYVFMHNGTLQNHWRLKQDLKEILEEIGVVKYTVPNTDVDSETLGTILTLCNGDPRKIEKVLGHVNGAYACIWIDQKAERLYLLRNNERPLYIGETSFGCILGSEAGMIHAIADRNNTKIKSYEGVDSHVLYTFKLNQKATTYTKEELTVKKSTPPSMTTYTTGRGATNLSDFQEVASKNAMKRFRGKFLGKTIPFWVTECKLVKFPVGSRALLIGECFLLDKTAHLIRGYIDLPSTTTPESIEGSLFYGTISMVDYDHEAGFLISVSNCKMNNYAQSSSLVC